MSAATAKPATTKAHILRAKLAELVARGVDGEKDSAARKLARLEAAFDFTAPNPDGADFFVDTPGASTIRRGQHARALDEVFTDSEIAVFVKFAILAAYKVDGTIRDNRNGTFTVSVEAEIQSIKTLNFIAKTLHDAFRALLAAFLKLPGASERDSRMFIRAVYDGALNDEKKPGEKLPERSPTKAAKGRKRSLVSVGLALHPYQIGVEMGRKVRLCVPVESIAGELAEAERIARLN